MSPELEAYWTSTLSRIDLASPVNSLLHNLAILLVVWLAYKAFDVKPDKIVAIIRTELVEFSRGNWNTASINAGALLLVAAIILLSDLSTPFKEFLYNLGQSSSAEKIPGKELGEFVPIMFLSLLGLGSAYIAQGKK